MNRRGITPELVVYFLIAVLFFMGVLLILFPKAFQKEDLDEDMKRKDEKISLFIGWGLLFACTCLILGELC